MKEELSSMEAGHGTMEGNSLSTERSLNVELLQQSFQVIAPQAEKFVAAFYQRLFQLYPEVEGIFSNTNMAGQRKKLLSALVLVMENLRQPHRLESALLDLGKKHQGYQVVAQHYPLAGEALLNTFANFLGNRWTPEMEEAWKTAYGVIAQTMLKGYSPPDGP
jgi:hemoglobin-like flavoprotein